MKVNVENLSKVSFLGKDLIKAIYSTAYRLEANYVVVNKARYNMYAEVELYENDNCIDWKYGISV